MNTDVYSSSNLIQGEIVLIEMKMGGLFNCETRSHKVINCGVTLKW